MGKRKQPTARETVESLKEAMTQGMDVLKRDEPPPNSERQQDPDVPSGLLRQIQRWDGKTERRKVPRTLPNPKLEFTIVPKGPK